ncbi:MAG TPA: aminotransferase class III-fold pyridoxal phosphate-dependent enzyme, partial [Candidatus Aquilonibacter sp.]|nr:aminotransferase class III-fold pyridoxal phosphate-dependent enzyme [Candidatus Aquilonibacter sp.]
MTRSTQENLAAEAFENYKLYVNPPLARVMKLSGSPVEVRASGTTIWDQNGKAYLDFAGGYGVFTLGHSHPRVIAAVKEQMESMSLSGKTMFNVVLGRAAKRLAELAPGDLQYSFWCNSGTEAVEGAIKLARAATGRSKIVATHDAYHGKTIGALSISGRETFQTPFRPLLADVSHVPFGDASMLDDVLA